MLTANIYEAGQKYDRPCVQFQTETLPESSVPIGVKSLHALLHPTSYRELMETALDRLREILDRLGPGLFLEVDATAFHALFGDSIGRETAELEAAQFAAKCNCFFSSHGKMARFGRAPDKP
jgi:hypothetical protein